MIFCVGHVFFFVAILKAFLSGSYLENGFVLESEAVFVISFSSLYLYELKCASLLVYWMSIEREKHVKIHGYFVQSKSGGYSRSHRARSEVHLGIVQIVKANTYRQTTTHTTNHTNIAAPLHLSWSPNSENRIFCQSPIRKWSFKLDLFKKLKYIHVF